MGSIKSTKSSLVSLDHVPLPAVICDENGFIEGANDLFLNETAKGIVGVGGYLLDCVRAPGFEKKGVLLAELAGKRNPRLSVRIAGKPYTMYVSREEEYINCFFTPDKNEKTASSGEELPLADPSSKMNLREIDVKMLEAFIRLSRDLNLTMREEELIELFVKTFENLFPGRLLCIRILGGDSKALTQVYANGRLRKEMRECLCLTSKTVEEFHLEGDDRISLEMFEQSGAQIVEEYRCVFEKGTSGFDIPLHDRSNFYGVINFEYTKDCEPAGRDRLIAIPLAQQMCTALRNARLVAETIVLKDYLEKLLDRANAPVVVVDKKRLIKVVNQAFERHTGYDREDILGEDFLTLLTEIERARILPVVLAALRGESTSNFEFKIPKASGTGNAHIAFNTGVILSAYGDLEGVIFVGQDLTEVRALQKQVIHSEKLATLGQVAAGVAHELNNPLTSISVYANYLVKTCTDMDEADRAKLRRIVDAAGRIQAFTRDLVTYARPSGEEPVLIEIPALIQRALSFCEHLIEEHKARVEFSAWDEISPVYGIRGQLEQVFVNLITNACHSFSDSGGTIEIDVRQADSERITITVSDTGRGIAADQIVNIFEPFYTTKPEGQGTGLGLSIVKNILLNHHASIEVESELGKGTVFSLLMYAG